MGMEEVRGSLMEALWALLRGMPTRLVHALQGSLYPPKPGRLVFQTILIDPQAEVKNMVTKGR